MINENFDKILYNGEFCRTIYTLKIYKSLGFNVTSKELFDFLIYKSYGLK